MHGDAVGGLTRAKFGAGTLVQGSLLALSTKATVLKALRGCGSIAVARGARRASAGSTS